MVSSPTQSSPQASLRGIYLARVQQNVRICVEHYRLTLTLAGFPATVPGQFVQVDCRQHSADPGPSYHEIAWPPAQAKGPLILQDVDNLNPTAFLRRPFSLADDRRLPGGGVEIDLIYRVVGKGTHYLETLLPGAEVSVLGPLGKGFALPADAKVALLVGGGVGIPPMFYLAKHAHAAGRAAVAFIGAQRAELLPLTLGSCQPAARADGAPVLNAHEFANWGYPSVITTDDGSMGMKGFVTQALEQWLTGQFAAGKLTPADMVVYCCGPTPMMKATAAVARKHNVVCQVSLEQPMACGMGTCQSCVVRYYPPGASDWVYKLTCTDGPVFDSRALKW